MRASVIVSAYDQDEELRYTLPLIDGQECAEPWELILCDDGSDALTVARRIVTKKRDAFRYIWQPHHGMRVARSRNNAIGCATGDVLILVDAYVAVPPGFVARHLALHREPRTLVCGTRRWLCLRDLTRPVEEVLPALLTNGNSSQSFYTEEEYQSRCSQGNPWASCISSNCSFTRSEAAAFDEEFVGWGFEDTEFAFRLHHCHRYSVRFVPELWGIHLEDCDSVSFRKIRPRAEPEITALLRNVVHFVDAHPGADVLPGCLILGNYELDLNTDSWRTAERRCFLPEHVRGLIATAREWLVAHPGRAPAGLG